LFEEGIREMTESTVLKCSICGNILIGKLSPNKPMMYVYCPSMDKTHDIYIIPILKGWRSK